MLDEHIVPAGFGVMPVLFTVGGVQIESYSFFVLLGIILAGGLFFYLSRKDKSKSSSASATVSSTIVSNSESAWIIGAAAILGGAIGSKLPLLFLYWNQIFSGEIGWNFLFYGKTITGGILGGIIGVIIVKKWLGIKSRKGNYFAPAIALGIAVGRLGCFFRGCCAGKPTSLPWGVNFGDGILRHPTQIYESIFCLCLMVYLLCRKNAKPGQLMDEFILIYFTWRFFIEFIRIEPLLGWLTVYQWISLAAIVYVFVKRKFFFGANDAELARKQKTKLN